MSISEKLTKLNTDIVNAYNSIQIKNGTIPKNKNTENLANAIESIESVATYTVTFNSDGGSTVEEQIIVNGQVAKEPDAPTKTNFIFVCWLSNGEPFDFDTPITSDITLVAKWYLQQVNYLMLYDFGDECTELTGGWDSTIFRTGLVEKNSSYMEIRSLRATAYTVNKINLSGYVKLASFNALTQGRTDVTTDVSCQWFVAKETLNIGNGLIDKDWNFNWKESYNKFRQGTSGYCNFINDLTMFSGQPIELNEDYYIGVMADGMPDSTATFIDLYNLAVFKRDNWQELCAFAGLDFSEYVDEATLCADSTAMSTILNNEETIKYMICNCTGTFMMEFINSDTALTKLNNSTYKTLVQANEHWNKFLNMVA